MPRPKKTENKLKPTSVRIDAKMLERLDAWIARQPVPPAIADVIRVALDRFLSSEEKKEQQK